MSVLDPPCIYAKEIDSAMGFDLCRSKLMNVIVPFHLLPRPKDAAKNNGTLLLYGEDINPFLSSHNIIFIVSQLNPAAACGQTLQQ